jgi:hypothetical protein
MLKKYSEYNNCELIEESFFDWLNQKSRYKGLTYFTTIMSGAFYGFNELIRYNNPSGALDILYMAIICAAFNVPLTLTILKRVLRKTYNIGAMSLWNINRKVRRAQRLIENSPELEDRLASIKMNLRNAIDKEDDWLLKKEVSRVFRLSRDLNRRKRYSGIFTKSEKEKTKEAAIKEKDPYGEEDWSN